MIKLLPQQKQLRNLLLSLFFLTSLSVIGQNVPFITTWNTGEGGNISIPINSLYTYNYHVIVKNTNEEVLSEQDATNNLIINDLPTNSVITVEITGVFPAISLFYNQDFAIKILNINQWGNIQWQSMNHAFGNCTNLACTATDVPDLSNVTDMNAMFVNATYFTGDISNWDVSNVTDMSFMFFQNENFNCDLSNWNVSNVTATNAMFFGAKSFNGDISSWDVSNVTSMQSMFSNAETFNADISDWNVSKATSLSYMFQNATSFNSELTDWDVSNVTWMNGMFNGAASFNRDLSSWDAYVDVKRNNLFNEAGDTYYTITYNNEGTETLGFYPSGHGNISLRRLDDKDGIPFFGWNKAVDFSGDIITSIKEGVTEDMTLYACWGNPFTTTWNTGADGSITIPTNSAYTYNYHVIVKNTNAEIISEHDATGELLINSLPTDENVSVEITGTFPAIYFYNSETSNNEKILSINQWGDIQWESMSGAFYDCSKLTSSATDSPNLSHVTSMERMFLGAESFNGDLSGWDVSSVTNMSLIFDGAISFNSDLSSWDVSNVTDMRFMFNGATNFNCDLSAWEVSHVMYMFAMFYEATNFNGDISPWNVSNVIDMRTMFYKANNFNCDLSSWNVSNVTDMSYMFYGATNFNCDLSSWDVGNVTQIESMFYKASSFNSKLSTWDIGNVTNMSNLFREATSFNNDISSWDVSNVTNMNYMFREASSFNGDLSSWNVDKVTNMYAMFAEATSYNSDLSNWNVSNVTDMRYMFYNATNFNRDLSAWDAKVDVKRDNMFTGAGDTYYTITYNNEGSKTLGFYPAGHSNISLKTLVATDDFTFYGWNKAADFSGEIITNIEQGVAEDMTLYALWSEATLSEDKRAESTCFIYPNPVVNLLYIKGKNINNIYATLYNTTGIVVAKLTINDLTNSGINMSNFAPGIYIVQIEKADGDQQSFKVVKK